VHGGAGLHVVDRDSTRPEVVHQPKGEGRERSLGECVAELVGRRTDIRHHAADVYYSPAHADVCQRSRKHFARDVDHEIDVSLRIARDVAPTRMPAVSTTMLGSQRSCGLAHNGSQLRRVTAVGAHGDGVSVDDLHTCVTLLGAATSASVSGCSDARAADISAWNTTNTPHVGDLEPDHLTGAQSGAVCDEQRGRVLQVRDRAEQSGDLLAAEHHGQGLRQAHRRDLGNDLAMPDGDLEEELQAAERRVDRRRLV